MKCSTVTVMAPDPTLTPPACRPSGLGFFKLTWIMMDPTCGDIRYEPDIWTPNIRKIFDITGRY